jgi:hypothetical protein
MTLYELVTCALAPDLILIIHRVTCSCSSEVSQQALPKKTAAASEEVAKSSKQKSKAALTQQKSAEAVQPKQPTAAEESFYTGRGVQPRKTIDGLPVFSLAEMVPPTHHPRLVDC